MTSFIVRFVARFCTDNFRAKVITYFMRESALVRPGQSVEFKMTVAETGEVIGGTLVPKVTNL